MNNYQRMVKALKGKTKTEAREYLQKEIRACNEITSNNFMVKCCTEERRKMYERTLTSIPV